MARALKSWHGPKPYVFTKCGLRWNAKGEVRKVLSAASIRSEAESSLRENRRQGYIQGRCVFGEGNRQGWKIVPEDCLLKRFP
jgi:hypothetical protein